MRTSNPPSYDKIFSIYDASGTRNINTALDPHRALLLVNSATTTNTTTVSIKNLDNSTLTLAIAPGATLLPLQVGGIGITTQSTSIRIYGLV